MLRARGGRPGRGRRRRRRGAVAGGGREGRCCRRVGQAAAAVALRGAAGLPPGQRVHPGTLPLRVVRPRRAPQRLRVAQRDAQRLDPPRRLLPLPGPRRRRRDGVAGSRRSGYRDHDYGDDVGQRVLGGGQQHHFGSGDPERAGPRCRRARGGAVAADDLHIRRHDVPVRERGGAPAGVPLAPLQPALLAAGLRGDRRHDRLLLLPARLLHLPRQPRRAARLPLRHHAPRRARRRRAAGAGPVLAKAPAHPRGPLRVHGPLGGRAGDARALAQLGAPRVLPRALARARHGARVRHGRRVLCRQGAGEVAPGDVRLRRAQPPDLPPARARRRAHALRRHRDPHRLARGHGRRRGICIVVTRRAERDGVYVGVECDIDSLVCVRRRRVRILLLPNWGGTWSASPFLKERNVNCDSF